MVVPRARDDGETGLLNPSPPPPHTIQIAPPSNSLPELATKKNRIEEPCDDEASDENEAVIKPSTEPSVDETREKVEKLSHEEGEKESELKTIHEESNKDHVKDKMESNTGDEDDNVQVVEMGQKRKMEMRVPSTSSITPDDVKRHKEGEPSVSRRGIRFAVERSDLSCAFTSLFLSIIAGTTHYGFDRGHGGPQDCINRVKLDPGL